MASRKLIVEIVGDTRDLEKSFRTANQKTDSFGKSMAKNLGKAGVAGAILGLGAAAKIGFDEFVEDQRVAAQTNAVLKSTGGVANVTAAEIDRLAGSLLKKSGVDDEQIKSGANMLLTFTKVRNEVGAGNDVFDQATKATLNLSVAMGKDMQSSAVLVGKALNDPIRGIGALSRVGVQLDEDQRKLIKTMVASGDTMGAQKVILKELETQFGGSAEAAGKTFSGQVNIAKESAANFAGDVTARLIPALSEVVGFVRENWPKIRQVIQSVSEDVRALWKQWGDEIMAVVRFVFPVIETLVRNTLKIIEGVVDVFVGVLTGDWRRAWEGIKGIVSGALGNIETLIRTGLTLIGKAALALGTGIKNAVVDGLEGIGAAAWGVIDNIGTRIQEVEQTVKGWGTQIGGWIKNAVIDGITGVVGGVWNIVNNIWTKFTEMTETVKSWGTRLATWIKTAIVDGFKGIGTEIWDGIKDELEDLKEKIQGFFGGAWKFVTGKGDVTLGFNSAAAEAARRGYLGAGAGAGTGGLAPQTANLLRQLQGQFGNLLVTSGFRTKEQNAAVNGAPGSDHLTGRAFDLVPATGWNPATIALFDRIAGYLAGLSSVRWIGWRGVPGHGPYDHLHVSTYERGGTVPGVGPQLAIVHGGETITPRGQAGPITLQVMLDRRVLAEAMYDPLRNVNQRFAQASGRSGF